MARTETVTLTNMCMVYDHQGNVLVQDRSAPDWPGIAFPGGHVEKGESFTDAVIREVYEETGVTISNPRLCGIKDWTNSDGSRYMVLMYKTDRFTGIARSSDEGSVSWMPLEALPKAKLSKNFDKMLQVFLNDDLSEFFFRIEDGNWIEILK